MDVILLCAFGIQADSQNNPDEPAITAAKKVVSGSASQRAILSLLSLLPFGNKLAEIFPSLLIRDMKDLLDISKQIVAAKTSATISSTSRKVRDLVNQCEMVYFVMVAFDKGERNPNRVLGVLCHTARKNQDFLCNGSLTPI